MALHSDFIFSQSLKTMLIRNGKSTNVLSQLHWFLKSGLLPISNSGSQFENISHLCQSNKCYFQDSVIAIHVNQKIFIIIRRNTIFLLKITNNLEGIIVQRIHI